MRPSPADHWTSRFRIAFHETGPDGRAGIVALANLLQQTAGEHAEALGLSIDRLRAAGLGWAMARQFVAIDAMPAGGARVAVETWPSTRDSHRFRREFVVCDAGGARLAAATCTWSVIDLATRAAAAIPAWFDGMVAFDDGRAVDYRTRVVARLRAPTHERAIVPRRADIDMNGHVNNAHLFGWMLEPLPDDAVAGRRLGAIDVMFRAECRAGDAPVARAAAVAPGRWRHAIVRADGGELARAETVWVGAA